MSNPDCARNAQKLLGGDPPIRQTMLRGRPFHKMSWLSQLRAFIWPLWHALTGRLAQVFDEKILPEPS
jgi:hypothetical protein